MCLKSAFKIFDQNFACPLNRLIKITLEPSINMDVNGSSNQMQNKIALLIVLELCKLGSKQSRLTKCRFHIFSLVWLLKKFSTKHKQNINIKYIKNIIIDMNLEKIR